MLYDFHKWQNDKRPGSLHATYLVYGTQRKAEQDGDVEMTDSMSDSGIPFSDEVPTKTLSLVKEEQLQGRSAFRVARLTIGTELNPSRSTPAV
jgi:DNA polymerase delta subunit 3